MSSVKTTESEKRFVSLSQSEIWQIQQDFFAQGGEVWKNSLVPNYITSNPFIANAYAQVTLAYLDDCYFHQLLEPNQRIYIVELGAGAGQFGYLFLKSFLSDYGYYQHLNQNICYVMTDSSPTNISYWQSHEQLKPYIDRGLLDFACFNASIDEELQLSVSKKIIDKNSILNPVIFIANYLFDCTPQDVFEIKNGELYEQLVSLNIDSKVDFKLFHPKDIKFDYIYQNCSPNHYKNDIWNDILNTYKSYNKSGVFLFPTWVFTVLERLKRFTNNKYLFLSGDKGHHHIDNIITNKYPKLGIFGGCFAFDVNYHAISEFVLKTGKEVLQTPYKTKSIDVLGFLFSEKNSYYSRTKHAFNNHIVNFSPDDFFIFKTGLENQRQTPTLTQIISYLRISKWDVRVLYTYYETLNDLLPEQSLAEKQGFREILEKTWDSHFNTNPENNPAFHIATLFGNMGFHKDAITYYQHSQRLSGNDANTEFNLGLCYLSLGDIEMASSLINNALSIEEIPIAKEFREKLKNWTSITNKTYGKTSRIKALTNYKLIKEKLTSSPITLEPLLPKYAQTLYKDATPEIMELTQLPILTNQDEAMLLINSMITDPKTYSFAITHKEIGFIGVISISIKNKKDGNKLGKFFYWLGQSYWGKGYGTTAVCQLVSFAFNTLMLDELMTNVLDHNSRSINILNKLGFLEYNSKNGLKFYRCNLVKN
ncbi:MAG: TPR repeat-containing protein [bacterium]|nr:MAG: TPR repeat-containing protein [bacterium]